MVKKLVDDFYYMTERLRIYLGEKRKIRKHKYLIKKCVLTREQKKAIDEIWIKNYGKKIPYDLHRLYTSYTGVFNEKYFPEILFTTNLLNKLNPPNRKRYLDSKIMIQYYFKRNR